MIATIQPVSLFKFGSANAVRILLNQDNLESGAQFYYQLGKWVQPATIPAVFDSDDNVVTPAIVPPKQFVGADNVIGNVSLDGDEYLSWDGSNESALALVLPKIPVTLAQ